ncbi:E3 ubiquitin-protein ligase rnf14 [Lobulomyces angularis]|nr:E3 ubiquitin-protein ligase rnf14 [Lobulomyces angularis]
MDDELLAMKAVFEEDFTFEISQKKDSLATGTFTVHSDRLENDLILKLGNIVAGNEYRVNYLPPITIVFEIPANYPQNEPLKFYCSSTWVPNLTLLKIKKKLLNVWKNLKDYCLFEYSEYLKRDFLENLDICDNILCVNGSEGLFENIILYNKERQQKLFDEDWFNCGVCGEEKKGIFCIMLAKCKHVFCKECLNEYFTLLITEGSIENVTCPDFECKRIASKRQHKFLSDIVDFDMKQIVEKDLFSRFKNLQEKKKLEGLNIIYCPRIFCQSPIIRESTDEKLCICSNCKFRNLESLVNSYLSENSEEKALIEKQYGKKNIEKIVFRYQEELKNKEWYSENSQCCPSCKAAIQKSEGCNHMTCSKCNTHFCYRCGNLINQLSPYAHFNDKNSPCYGKLFDFNSEGNEEWALGEFDAEIE